MNTYTFTYFIMKAFQCNDCGESYSTKHSLSTHRTKYHKKRASEASNPFEEDKPMTPRLAKIKKMLESTRAEWDAKPQSNIKLHINPKHSGMKRGIDSTDPREKKKLKLNEDSQNDSALETVDELKSEESNDSQNDSDLETVDELKSEKSSENDGDIETEDEPDESDKMRKKRRMVQNHQKPKRRRVTSARNKCRICKRRFATAKELRKHVKLRHYFTKRGVKYLQEESEDKSDESTNLKRKRSDDEEESNPKRKRSDAPMKCQLTSDGKITHCGKNNVTRDKMKKAHQTAEHIGCVGIEEFLKVYNLMKSEQYDEILKNDGDLHILHLLFNGLKTGWIPLCGYQLADMSDEAKKFIDKFSDNLSVSDTAVLLSSNKETTVETFKSVYSSIKFILESWMAMIDRLDKVY